MPMNTDNHSRISDERIEEMLALAEHTYTPTVEEWYGGREPSFPDDDGEEMRRVSSVSYAVRVRRSELRSIL